MNIISIFGKKKNSNTVNVPGNRVKKDRTKKQDNGGNSTAGKLSKSEREHQLASWFIAMR